MSSSSLDFKLENYSQEELEDLFGIHSVYPPVNKSLLEERSNIIIQQVQEDPSVDESLKKKTIFFLTQAKNKLLDQMVDGVSSSSFSSSFMSVGGSGGGGVGGSVGVNGGKNDLQSIITKSFSSLIQSPYEPPFLEKSTPVSDEKEVFSHAVQIRAPNPSTYSHSYPSEYYRGVINPLQKRIIRQNINIDTRFRSNYYQTLSTDYLYMLPAQLPPALSLQLTAIELPNSYFAIAKALHNNAFSISAGDEKIVYIVPDGNYTPQDLTAFLNNYATNNGYTALSNPMLFYMAFALNINGSPPVGESGSAQMILGVKDAYGPTPFPFRVSFNESDSGVEDTNTPLQWKLGWMLGFRSAIYEGGSSYVSEGIVDVSGPKYCYLQVDDFNNSVNNGFYALLSESVINNNILGRITLPNDKTKFFQISNWNLSSNSTFLTTARQYFGPANLFKLHIRLIDEYGRILNLNNMDFSFCLSIECLYDV